jgi:hypothetical protein
MGQIPVGLTATVGLDEKAGRLFDERNRNTTTVIAYSAIHPIWFVPFSKVGERIRGRFIRMIGRAATRMINRVLLESIQWTASRPDEILLAYVECERRLTELVEDPEVGPFVGPVLHEVTEAIERMLERIALGEIEARVA